MKRICIKLTGKVQAVGFRMYVQDIAKKLEINGIVRNDPNDKSLYIEAESDEETLNDFLDYVKQGPPRAKIENCSVKEAELVNYKQFLIRI